MFSSSHRVHKLSAVDPSLFPNWLQNRQGLWLFTRKWEVAKPRAFIYISHGFGEHIGRYEHIAKILNREGYTVYGIDHQGHGQSQGERAHVERFSDYVEDFLTFVEWTQKGEERVPVVLLGHSMGGAIAFEVMRASYQNDELDGHIVEKNGKDEEGKTVAENTSAATASPASSASAGGPTGTSSVSSKGTASSSSAIFNGEWKRRVWPWSGCVFSSPLFLPDAKTATPFLKGLASFLASAVPKMATLSLDSTAISRIPLVVDRYNEDVLNYHGGMKARWAHQIVQVLEKNIGPNLKNVAYPFLTIHGTADRLTDPEGSKALYAEATSKDKSIKLYEGHYHELFNDLARDKVFQDVLQWLDAHTPHI